MKIGSRLGSFPVSAVRQRLKPADKQHGFTIVETLVVLAVTGFLFAMAVVLINGKQNTTEFNTGTRELQSRLQQVIDEVTNGYYPNNGTFKCNKAAGAPQITPVGGGPSVGQGTNKDCIFLGKVIQFNVGNANPEVFHVYSVAGLRETSPGTLAQTVPQANPRLITFSGAYDVVDMPYSMTVQFVRNTNDNSNIGAIGFLSNLGSVDIQGPSQQIDLIPISNTSLGQSMGSDVTTIENNLASSATSQIDPANGVQVCVKSGGTDQSALYTIGGQGRQLTISVTIKNGPICA